MRDLEANQANVDWQLEIRPPNEAGISIVAVYAVNLTTKKRDAILTKGEPYEESQIGTLITDLSSQLRFGDCLTVGGRQYFAIKPKEKVLA